MVEPPTNFPPYSADLEKCSTSEPSLSSSCSRSSSSLSIDLLLDENQNKPIFQFHDEVPPLLGGAEEEKDDQKHPLQSAKQPLNVDISGTKMAKANNLLGKLLVWFLNLE